MTTQIEGRGFTVTFLCAAGRRQYVEVNVRDRQVRFELFEFMKILSEICSEAIRRNGLEYTRTILKEPDDETSRLS